ncbi:MAG: methyltransferase domain-containing protein [Pseudomonadota bacterium]
MNWKLKGTAFRLLDMLPFGHGLYRMAQRLVTRTSSEPITPALLRLHQYHVRNYLPVAPGRALEFGGGRDLLSPLLLSQAGASEVLVYDIERHSSPDQVNHCIRQLRALQPGEWPEVVDCGADLQAKYRIRYVAPGDARATGLPDGSVSFIVSTSTLEHIPEPDVRRIMAECTRIAAPGAIMSHVIDYKDHYYYSQDSIGMFNFYRYSARAWRWWSPPNNNQNRLRHSDFAKIFDSAGLIRANVLPHLAEAETLRGLELAPEFQGYSSDDLLTHSAYFVLQRP